MDNYLQTFAEVIRIVTFQFNPERRRLRGPGYDRFDNEEGEFSRWSREGWPRPRR